METKQSKTNNIHDDNFKHNFTSKYVARDFVKHNLPPKLLNSIDIETLQIEPTEFLPSRYRDRRNADILYSVKNRQGKRIYTLLHLEAQSSHDKYMALRVWEYQVAIAQAHIKRSGDKIPLILTFVLYHGKSKWTSAKSIAELFDDFNLYVNMSLKAPFLLNLAKAEIEGLKKQGAASAPQLIMKGQALGDYCEMLGELWPLLEEYNQVDEENINYITTTDKHEEPIFLEKLRKFDPITANNYKAMFEAAIQKEHKKALKLGITKGLKEGELKGKKEGLKEGELKGKKEGLKEGKVEIAKQMLADGAPIVKIIQYTGLSLEQISN